MYFMLAHRRFPGSIFAGDVLKLSIPVRHSPPYSPRSNNNTLKNTNRNYIGVSSRFRGQASYLK